MLCLRIIDVLSRIASTVLRMNVEIDKQNIQNHSVNNLAKFRFCAFTFGNEVRETSAHYAFLRLSAIDLPFSKMQSNLNWQIKTFLNYMLSYSNINSFLKTSWVHMVFVVRIWQLFAEYCFWIFWFPCVSKCNTKSLSNGLMVISSVKNLTIYGWKCFQR